MADFNALHALINAYIKKNGVKAITGQILNGVLSGMVNALGKGFTVAGAATPETDPGTMTGPLAYIAYTAGTYPHFGGLVVEQGEVAMFMFNENEWTKDVLFSLAATASVDDTVGTPSVGVSFVDGLLTFDFHNLKGETGEPAGFGHVTATVDANIGTPSVTVQESGPDTAKNYTFAFRNLKGETGVTSVVATVDNTIGTPSCAVSLNGQELHLDFHGLKGMQGDTGVSADYPIAIVNNLTTSDPASALSAQMGVQLEGELGQLEAKVTGIPSVEIDLSEYQLTNGTIAGNTFYNSGNYGLYHRCLLIPVSEYVGRKVKIVPGASAPYNRFLATILAQNVSAGSPVVYATGYSEVVTYTGTTELQIPDNGAYIYFYITDTRSSETYLPDSVEIVATPGEFYTKPEADAIAGELAQKSEEIEVENGKYLKTQTISVAGIYSAISPLPSQAAIVLKIQSESSLGNINIALARSESASTITTTILNGTLEEGISEFSVTYDGEGYIRVYDGNSYPAGVTINIFESLYATIEGIDTRVGVLEDAVDGVAKDNKEYDGYIDGVLSETDNLFDRYNYDSAPLYVNSSNKLVLSTYFRLLYPNIAAESGKTYALNTFGVPESLDAINLVFSTNEHPTENDTVTLGGSNTTHKRAQITAPSNGYIFVYFGSYSITETDELTEKMVAGIVVRESSEFVDEYIPHKEIKISSTPEEIGAVNEFQGLSNVGKALVVGSDGKVSPAVISPEGTLDGYYKQEKGKTIYLGENVLNGVVGSGTGWSHSNGVYTHTAGTDALEFNLSTESGERYVAIFNTGSAQYGENALNVTIGNNYVCDAYNGHTDNAIGFISDGGKLKFVPNNYVGSINGVELRKVVSEGDAVTSINLVLDDVENGSMSTLVTGWWNVAIGADNTQSKNVNGSRNIAIGYASLPALEAGERNVGVGTFSMSQLKYGYRNIAIGADSLYTANESYDSVSIGKGSMGNMTHPVFRRCIAIGTAALGASGNVLDNVAIGKEAMYSAPANSVGNVCIGTTAGMYANSYNTCVGLRAGYWMKGSGNTCIGSTTYTLYVTGDNNTILGSGASIYDAQASSSNIVTINNAIAIGAGAKATKSNQCVIGANSVTEFVLGGKKLVFNQDGTVSWIAA